MSNGTNSTNKTSDIDTRAIIEIISACHSSGVRQFEYGSLKLSFDQVPDVHISPENPKREAADREEEEVRLKQEELDTLRLSDPFEYEKLMMQNELELERA